MYDFYDVKFSIRIIPSDYTVNFKAISVTVIIFAVFSEIGYILLQIFLGDLIQLCHFSPPPDGVCRHHTDNTDSRTDIYRSDPDFKVSVFLTTIARKQKEFLLQSPRYTDGNCSPKFCC